MYASVGVSVLDFWWTDRNIPKFFFKKNIEVHKVLQLITLMGKNKNTVSHIIKKSIKILLKYKVYENHMIFCEHSLAKMTKGAFLLLLLSPPVAQLLPTSSFHHFLSSKYTSICAESKTHNDRKPKKMPTHLSFPYFLATSSNSHVSLPSNATILGMSHLLGRKSITGHLKLW